MRAAAAAACAASVVAALPAAGTAASAPPAEDSIAEARAAAGEFLDRYVDASGRVVRRDSGGDTVSEGQAYGMLAAVALGDEQRFRLVWAWTDEHLQRDDGLLAWRWADGRVVDDQPAADADLLAAAALALAGRRFDAQDLRADAQRLDDAVLAHEVIALGTAPVLVAGPWAEPSRTINASYLVTPAMSLLWELVGERRWGPVATWSRSTLAELTSAAPHLPPDWATVDAAGGNPQAQASPGGDPPLYGYEAARVIVQAAVDCRAAGQRIAAQAWPFLRSEVDAGELRAIYALDGQALSEERHPLALVAAAAAAAAAGEPKRSAELLDAAERLDDEAPSYFGAAWVALGRLWLGTDLLGGCRPGAATRP